MININRLQYKNLLDFWADDNDIKNEDVCIVSGASLTVRSLRKNNDIDFTINPRVKEEVPLGLDNTETTGSFGQSVGHPLKNYPGNNCSEKIEYIYNKYNPIGLTDNQLFSSPKYYDILDGYKIVRPEISASYRQIRSKSSDSTDVRSIGKYIRQTNDWDWNLLKITEMESEKAPPETKIDNSENWAKLF